MIVRIVVADEREASFFDAENVKAPLELASKLENPNGRAQRRDLESDRAGRSFDSTSAHRHAMDGERHSRRWHEQIEFARKIVEEIDHGRVTHQFDRLVLIAGPRMLGLIRDALPAQTGPLIAAEVPKDLAHMDETAIREYVPKEAFRSGSSARG